MMKYSGNTTVCSQIGRKGIRFSSGMCAVAAIMIVSFCATTAMAQKSAAKAPSLSEAAVQSALQRALPGATAASGGTGPGVVREQRMISGQSARTVNMSSVPQVTTFAHEDHDRPLSGLTETEYQSLKSLVAKRAAAGEIGSAPSKQKINAPGKDVSSLYVGRSAGFFAQSEICCDPPDMSLAVGTKYVLQMVNNYLAVYSKTGVLESGFPKDADTFFNLPAGTYTTDPRAFYDWENGRFFVLELTETNTSNPSGSPNVGAVAWAVSETNDPTGNWYVYNNSIPQSSGTCPDFPTLGHDTTDWGTGATKGGIYIGLNLWTGANDCKGDHFSNNIVYLIPKDPIYKGEGWSGWEFNGFSVNSTLVDTLQPANVTSKSTNPSSVFLVNSYNYNWGNGICSGGCNGLAIWSISGPTAGTKPNANNPFQFLNGVSNGPTVTGKTIATTHNYSTPPNAGEPGCTASSGGCIDTDYTFISGQVKYNAGELFGSFNTGVAVSPAVVGPIWFDIHPETDNNGQLTSVVERQEDCFLCGGWGSNGSSYYASLQPDPENNVLMVYDFSSDAAYPGTVWTSRRVTYGDSLMDGGGAYLEGGAASVSGRWGDYSATAPDLSGALGVMWFSAQYATSSGGWGTVIGSAEYHYATSQ
jgi:hypothetical protein